MLENLYMFFKQKKNNISKNVSTSHDKKFEVIIYQKTYAVDYILRNSITISESNTKPIIKLDKLKTNFRTPYSGYLTVKADYSEICFEDNSFIIVQGDLERFYLDCGVVIQICNPKNLKAIFFCSR